MSVVLTWLLVTFLFAFSFYALKFPWLPGFLFIYAGLAVYGFTISFDPFGWLFWAIMISFTVLLFFSEIITNAYALKHHGGSQAAFRGSILGMIFGPFLIPFAGLFIGPFLGAFLAEFLFNKRPFKPAIRIGLGTLIALFGSIALKIIIQALMIITFLGWVIWN